MKPLTIELKKGERQEYTFIGWKDDRRNLYALDPQQRRVVVELKPAYPGNSDTGEDFRFPFLRPKEIILMRLVQPPCAASKEEAESLRAHGQEALYPGTEHKKPLSSALKSFLDKARQDRAQKLDQARKAKTEDLFPFEGLRKVSGQTLHDSEAIEAERRRVMKSIEDEYRAKIALTLEDVKRGEGDEARRLRDNVLLAAWAKKTATDLQAMALAAESHAWQWQRAYSNSGEYENEPETEWAKQSVRWVITFHDGEDHYLWKVVVRDHLTPKEASEVAELMKSLEPATTPTLAQPEPQTEQASLVEDYSFVNLEATQWRKAGPQMKRRGKLAEHYRTTKDASGFRDLLDSHKERWFYPVNRIGSVRAALKKGDKSPVAAQFDMTDWDETWHPNSVPNWKHPGKKSVPKRVDQS